MIKTFAIYIPIYVIGQKLSRIKVTKFLEVTKILSDE